MQMCWIWVCAPQEFEKCERGTDRVPCAHNAVDFDRRRIHEHLERVELWMLRRLWLQRHVILLLMLLLKLLLLLLLLQGVVMMQGVLLLMNTPVPWIRRMHLHRSERATLAPSSSARCALTNGPLLLSTVHTIPPALPHCVLLRLPPCAAGQPRLPLSCTLPLTSLKRRMVRCGVDTTAISMRGSSHQRQTNFHLSLTRCALNVRSLSVAALKSYTALPPQGLWFGAKTAVRALQTPQFDLKQ